MSFKAVFLLVLALGVFEPQSSVALPVGSEGEISEFLAQNLTALWEEVAYLRQEVEYHLHHDHHDRDHDKTLREVETLHHEHHVHHLHHPHEGHNDHHDAELLKHLEEVHGHGGHSHHGHSHDDDNHDSGEDHDHSDEDHHSGEEDHDDHQDSHDTHGHHHLEDHGEDHQFQDAHDEHGLHHHEDIHEYHFEHHSHDDSEQPQKPGIRPRPGLALIPGRESSGQDDHFHHDEHHHFDHHHDNQLHDDHHHDDDHHDDHGHHGDDHHHETHHHDAHHHDDEHHELEHHHHHSHDHDDPWMYATCRLRPNTDVPDSHVSGHIVISQRKDKKGPVFFDLSLKGFDVENGRVHGFHIHENAVTDGQCATAGGHFNPFSVDHGGPSSTQRHVGDLGNIEVGEDGELEGYIVTDHHVAFTGDNNIIGKAIVVHSGEDDLGQGGDEGSRTTGNAGGRLACCNIYIGAETYFRFKG